MHNWLKGILQHHLHALWGIGQDEKESRNVKEMEEDEQWNDMDVSDSADELDDLFEEAAKHDHETFQNTPPMSISPPSSLTGTLTISSFTPSASSSTSTPTQSHPYAFDDDDDDSDYIPIDTLPFSFPEPQLQAIMDCIQDSSLPTWIQRPPINLGEPGHGKLKAQEFLSLFTCIFPLIIPKF
jgi:hypothetical protein